MLSLTDNDSSIKAEELDIKHRITNKNASTQRAVLRKRGSNTAEKAVRK
jgi:hypothetical protein